MFKVEIPEPCGESWEGMKPSAEGRFCDRCCKVVVDFTTKTADEIRDFFRAKKGERVCGRYKTEQVQFPAARQKKQLLARFALALYFVFGGILFTSCGPGEVMGARISGDSLRAAEMEQKNTMDSLRLIDSLQKQAQHNMPANTDSTGEIMGKKK